VLGVVARQIGVVTREAVGDRLRAKADGDRVDWAGRPSSTTAAPVSNSVEKFRGNGRSMSRNRRRRAALTPASP
jgi:hypothetical protein